MLLRPRVVADRERALDARREPDDTALVRLDRGREHDADLGRGHVERAREDPQEPPGDVLLVHTDEPPEEEEEIPADLGLRLDLPEVDEAPPTRRVALGRALVALHDIVRLEIGVPDLELAR